MSGTYVWRILNLAIWEEKQIGGYLISLTDKLVHHKDLR